jgi:hypothetical protein
MKFDASFNASSTLRLLHQSHLYLSSHPTILSLALSILCDGECLYFIDCSLSFVRMDLCRRCERFAVDPSKAICITSMTFLFDFA